ncbi:MAG: DUF2187 family protein [Bacillota bacterium]|uniref:DUF2187 family protein n=1 Tax=Fictibacillus sp. 18YEL24 TaxID=2745875 RepID=UPI0018CDF71F|nr:DUF2187 family protein [Fictibacillus sp. 18YEL24]MBH0171484.1 DUF2187 family protein [Fictibacillus sp. 18YEL24]
MIKANIGDVILFNERKGKVVSVLQNTVVVDTTNFTSINNNEEVKLVVRHKDYRIISN